MSVGGPPETFGYLFPGPPTARSVRVLFAYRRLPRGGAVEMEEDSDVIEDMEEKVAEENPGEDIGLDALDLTLNDTSMLV